MKFNLFLGKDIKRKQALFRETARNFILSAQNGRYPSCEEILMQEVEVSLQASVEDIKEWGPDYNYQEWAVRVVVGLSQEFLCSGRFHIYSGMLKPIGLQLHEVFKKGIFKLRDMGVLTNDDCHEYLENMEDAINSVG